MFIKYSKPILRNCQRMLTKNWNRTRINFQPEPPCRTCVGFQTQSRLFVTGSCTTDGVSDFTLGKVVLVRKITRYEYEKQLKPDLNEVQLKEYVSIFYQSCLINPGTGVKLKLVKVTIFDQC